MKFVPGGGVKLLIVEEVPAVRRGALSASPKAVRARDDPEGTRDRAGRDGAVG